MKRFGIGILLLFVSSCIPIQYAPKIADYKIVVAKRFKRDLPKHHAFVFEDNKDADEFYRFLFWKYGRNDMNIETNLPFPVGDSTYYMTFYERPKRSVTLNLLPIAVDAIMISQGAEPVLDEMDVYESGEESWYILITVSDAEFRDCLNPSFPHQEEIIAALAALREQYENTHHYVEAFLIQE